MFSESRENTTIWSHLNVQKKKKKKEEEDGKNRQTSIKISYLSSNLKEMLQELYIVYNSLQWCP